LLGLDGFSRLGELMLSRRRAARGGRQAAARSYPAMVALHVALFGAPLAERALARRRARAPLPWVGVLAGATALRWWCIGTLGEAWNVRAVVPPGLRPVTAGPYRFVRHPNYVAVALEFLALPMAGGAWVSALTLSALNGLVLWHRIREEERLLAAVPGYEEAFRDKARFVPRVL
jgi:methyltransferase